jgi:hypothetical protein
MTGRDVSPHPGRVVSGGLLRPFVAIDARPLAVDGVVSIDARERTLVVRPARDARGLAEALWGEGHRAQVESERRRFHGTAPTVWARGAGQDRIALGLPGDDGTMRFRFSPGDPNYKKLVATPGLSATIVVDRGSSHILSVRFQGRRT